MCLSTVASARGGSDCDKEEEEVSRRPANESRQEAEKRFLLATVRINVAYQHKKILGDLKERNKQELFLRAIRCSIFPNWEYSGPPLTNAHHMQKAFKARRQTSN